MRIGIIGARRIGGNAARLFVNSEPEVMLASCRDAAKPEALPREIGARASTGRPAEAATFGQVVMLSVPWGAIEEALASAGSLEGRVIIDTTNQFGSGEMPAEGQTAADFNASRMPGTRYTKAFKTLTSGGTADAGAMEPPRRDGAVYGEEYHRALTVVAATDRGGPDLQAMWAKSRETRHQ